MGSERMTHHYITNREHKFRGYIKDNGITINHIIPNIIVICSGVPWGREGV